VRIVNAYEMNTRLIAAAKAVEEAQAELESQTVMYAESERRYRQAKAMAYLQATGKTVAEREAHAELENGIGELRFARDVAEGKKNAALEAVRSRRAILSAEQTLTKLVTVEAEFTRTGPSGSVAGSP
jgi:hypothetical protein